jgi:beta-glucanase (GH16 family)
MKKLALCLVLMAFVAPVRAAFNLVPNGNFETAGGASWVFAGGGATISYPTTGGNPNGYAAMNSAGGWGVLVAQVSGTEGLPLSSLGLIAGSNYTFRLDMKRLSAGSSLAGIKLEGWNAGVKVGDTGDIKFTTTTSWATYSTNWTIPATATSIMFVPLSVDGGNIGFDNIGVVVPDGPLTVAITSPTNGATVTSNFTINATATVSPGTVTNVAFYDGAALLGNDATAPFSYAFNGAALGAHALKAIARDSAGNSATSSVVNVTVSNLPPLVGWQLAWADEFTQANGTAPDPTKWGYDIGGGGWGNNELQTYTSRTNNARIENDQLVIEAKAETFTGPDNITRNYTSARLLTQGKWSWAYGRMEARIKVPRTQGIWPAFWMLGTNIAQVGWPTCGEIDIMEHIGREPKVVYGTVHGPGYSGSGGVSGSYTFAPDVADDFRVFAVEWTTNQIKWFVDGINYFTVTPANIGGNTWVFNQPQFFLLNVAVGGNWPGNPDGTTVMPQKMLVDYVRVYTNAPAPLTLPTTPTGLKVSPGDAKAFVSWNAVAGATGYQIKRASVSGGPFTTIATSAVNNFTDITVGNCASYFYTVAATNSLGSSSNASEAVAVLGASALAVNSGGSATGHFAADANVTGGTIGAVSTATIDTTGVAAPAPQGVYQAERYGNFTYTFPGLIAGATYQVRLHSAETYWTAVGQRRFNVLINGAPVLTNFDIIAAAGTMNKAVISEFNAVATGGQIVIEFVTVTDNARAGGIEIILPRPAAPAGVSATPGNAQVDLKWNGIPGATYHVKRAATSGGPYTTLASAIATTNYTDVTVTNDVTYHYVVAAELLGCASTNSTFVSATPACTPPVPPVASNNGPLWQGMTLNLAASTVPGATYAWTGPNGFASTNQNPSVPGASTNDAGIYSVVATVGGCSSTPATTTAIINPPARLDVQSSPQAIVLSWPGGTLQSATNIAGPWTSDSGAVSPRTNPATMQQQFFRLLMQ